MHTVMATHIVRATVPGHPSLLTKAETVLRGLGAVTTNVG